MSATNIIINDETPRRQYVASSGQVTFDFPFPFFLEGDLTVYLTPAGQVGDDTADLLTLTTDYTVNGADTQNGGEIVLNSGAATGDIITIERVVDVARTADYQTAGDFLAETLNQEQDLTIMMLQQLRSEIDRVIRRSSTSTSDADLTLPNPEANYAIGWNADADALVNFQAIGTYQGSDATTTTSAYVLRDLVKSTTAGQLDNVYICIQDSPAGTLLTNTSYWALIIDAVSAGTSAAAAATSESNAATSESNAATSESNAATSESNAATSASNASTSEANALASANAASTSAGNASTSETNAAASAAAALISEGNASTSETNAAASAAAAASSYDDFDDRYLGQKAVAPTLDNDGGALLTGALYFNTVDNSMYVYTGSAWVSVSNTASSAAAAASAAAALVSEGNAATSEANAAASAALINTDNFVDQDSDTGAANLPTGTTAQRPVTPVEGMFRRNTETGSFEGYDGSAWSGVGGASGGAGNPFVYENDQVVTADYTITSGKNAMSTGVLTINSGVTVTVPTGSRWVVI